MSDSDSKLNKETGKPDNNSKDSNVVLPVDIQITIKAAVDNDPEIKKDEKPKIFDRVLYGLSKIGIDTVAFEQLHDTKKKYS